MPSPIRKTRATAFAFIVINGPVGAPKCQVFVQYILPLGECSFYFTMILNQRGRKYQNALCACTCSVIHSSVTNTVYSSGLFYPLMSTFSIFIKFTRISKVTRFTLYCVSYLQRKVQVHCTQPTFTSKQQCAYII